MGNCDQLRKYHGCVASFTFRIYSRISAPVCDPATTIGYEVRTTSAEDKYEETTTSVSEHDEMEAHFVGEWSKMINKIANVFNDIFAGFGGFHG